MYNAVVSAPLGINYGYSALLTTQQTIMTFIEQPNVSWPV